MFKFLVVNTYMCALLGKQQSKVLWLVLMVPVITLKKCLPCEMLRARRNCRGQLSIQIVTTSGGVNSIRANFNFFTQLLLVERFLSLSEEGGSAKGETRMLILAGRS